MGINYNNKKDRLFIYKEKKEKNISAFIEENDVKKKFIYTVQDYKQNEEEKKIFEFKYQIPNLLLDRVICIFKTLDKKYYLLTDYYCEIYFGVFTNGIEIYDIKSEKITTVIKDFVFNSNDSIVKMNYYAKGKKEYLLIITFYSNVILYDIKTFREIVRMKKNKNSRGQNGFLLFDKKDNPIIYFLEEYVYNFEKYNLKGKFLGEFKPLYNDRIYQLELFFDEIKNNSYLIYLGSQNSTKKILSYEATNENFKLYNSFKVNNDLANFDIKKIKNEILLFIFDNKWDGELRDNIANIYIYDFHNNKLLYHILEERKKFKKLFCYNENILICANEKEFDIYDWKNKKYLGYISNEGKEIISFNKINHPRFKECLVVQSKNDIKLFKLKEYYNNYYY